MEYLPTVAILETVTLLLAGRNGVMLDGGVNPAVAFGASARTPTTAATAMDFLTSCMEQTLVL
jgi:hypothetical protein